MRKIMEKENLKEHLLSCLSASVHLVSHCSNSVQERNFFYKINARINSQEQLGHIKEGCDSQY